MSDAAIATVVTGAITICGMIVGFLTLWVRLKYGIREASNAANVAATAAVAAKTQAAVVEQKLDANTATTEAVNNKAATIVEQTNGTLHAVKTLVQTLADRVVKLEDYNHESTHRLNDAIHAMHLKVAEMVAVQQNVNSVPKKEGV